MSKSFIASLIIFTAMSSAFAAGGAKVAPEAVIGMKEFTEISKLLPDANLNVQDFADRLAKGITEGTFSKDANISQMAMVEHTFTSILGSLSAKTLPDGVTPAEVRAQAVSRIGYLNALANCVDCSKEVVIAATKDSAEVTLADVLRTLAFGKELSDMGKWNKNSKGFKNMVKYAVAASNRIQHVGSNVPASMLSSDLKAATLEFIKENKLSFTYEQFIKALIANCA